MEQAIYYTSITSLSKTVDMIMEKFPEMSLKEMADFAVELLK